MDIYLFCRHSLFEASVDELVTTSEAGGRSPKILHISNKAGRITC